MANSGSKVSPFLTDTEVMENENYSEAEIAEFRQVLFDFGGSHLTSEEVEGEEDILLIEEMEVE